MKKILLSMLAAGGLLGAMASIPAQAATYTTTTTTVTHRPVYHRPVYHNWHRPVHHRTVIVKRHY